MGVAMCDIFLLFDFFFTVSMVTCEKSKGAWFYFLFVHAESDCYMKRSLRITPDMVSDTVPDMDMKKSAQYCLPLWRHVCKMYSECV